MSSDKSKLRQLQEMSDELRGIVAEMERPSWDDTWMLVANVMSLRATCPRRHVGCVIVSPDQRILSTGYNGSPRGFKHCADSGCVLDGLGRCVSVVHAEANAIYQASRQGSCLLGAHAFCTDRPCISCALALIQIGVSSIMWANDHIHADERDAVIELFHAANIEMRVYNFAGLAV